jgi:hypothetical protein
MMPVIRVSDHTWQRMQQHARPFEDKPEDVINLALDALDKSLGRAVPAKAPDPSKVEPKRPAAGAQKLPQKELRWPLVETLRELGGGAHVSEIKALLEKKVEHKLGEADYLPVSTGDARWWNAACWERDAMVKEGLLASGSKRGYWELSEMSMRTHEELDAMDAPTFGKWAYEHLAIEKPDFRPVRIGNPSAVVDDLPVGIEKMLEQLRTTQSDLVELVKIGVLARPRKLPDGGVEWTRSELMTLLPLRGRR